VYNATDFRASCPQSEIGSLSKTPGLLEEDCLFLNIFAPDGTKEGSDLPVMIWIHGGGNAFGSGSRPSYDGVNLTSHNDVMLVTLNYRLGVLGQYASELIKDEDPEMGTTGGMNYLMDQMEAMRFVKRHIKAFGGDPNQVTIFGESAGGVSVCSHIASPLSKGLYARAIIESGPCTGPWGPQPTEMGLTNSKNCAAALGCTGWGSLDCMRRKPWKSFISTQECSSVYISVDGHVLKGLAAEAYNNGTFLHIHTYSSSVRSSLNNVHNPDPIPDPNPDSDADADPAQPPWVKANSLCHRGLLY